MSVLRWLSSNRAAAALGLASLSLALLFFALPGLGIAVPSFVLYAMLVLAVVLAIAAVGVIVVPQHRDSDQAPLQAATEAVHPEPSTTALAPVSGPALLKAKGTNDGHFPRVESASDSLGHMAERTTEDSLYAVTRHVLRPGQEVSFELEATDPNGDDLELSVITPGQTEAEAGVAISGGVVTWTVGDEDIADPAHVHIYVTSQRSYHRHRLFDDGASFVYRVLPRL